MISYNEEIPCFNKYMCDTIHFIPNKEYRLKAFSDTVSKITVVDVYGHRTELIRDVDYHFGAINNTDVFELYPTYDNQSRCYLEFEYEDGLIYSDIIKISSKGKELTTRVDYRCEEDNILYSTQLPMYFRNFDNEIELNTYKEVSRGIQVSYISTNSRFSNYIFDFVDIDIYNKLITLFQYNEVYFNYELVNLYDVPEKEELKGDNNGVSVVLKISLLGENIKPEYVLITEDSEDQKEGFLGVGDWEGVVTNGKFYEIQLDKEDPYILLDDSEVMYISDLQESHLRFYFEYKQSYSFYPYITTENDLKIQIDK